MLKLKSHFWVIATNSDSPVTWINKSSPVQNKELKPNRELCSMFNKMAIIHSKKRIMAKQSNGTDEDSVIIADQYLLYLFRNNPLLTHGVALIYYRSF